MIRVRVDDFPNAKDEGDRHSLTAYKEFHRALCEGIGNRRYALGVIPKRCSPEHLLYLRTIDVEIGMHGTDHDEQRLNRNGGSQFEHYLTRERMRDELSSCKTAMEMALGRPVWMYMPPRNVVDLRTLNAVWDVGFVAFTGGPETDEKIANGYLGLRTFDLPRMMYFHSQKPHEYGRTDEMWNLGSHEVLTGLDRNADVILTLHWTWETNIGLSHMRQFLAAIPDDRFGDFYL